MLHVTSNATPITHLVHRRPPKRELAPSRSALVRLPSLSDGLAHPFVATFSLSPSSPAGVTSSLLRHNPRHHQVCEGMNEKLQGGLVKFLLRPPPSFHFLRSLSHRRPPRCVLSVPCIRSFSFVSALARLRSTWTLFPKGTVITAERDLATIINLP